MTLTEIETEIPKLSFLEKLKLMRQLATDVDAEAAGEAADGEDWDEQITADMKAGRLDFLFEEAIAEHKRGESLPGFP